LSSAHWQTVSTRDGVASVEMPGKPEETNSTTDTDNGPVTNQRFGIVLRRENMIFYLTHYGLPLPEAEQRQNCLKTFPKTFISLADQKGLHPTLVKQSSIHQDALEGMEYTFSDGTMASHARVYAEAEGIYYVFTIVPTVASESDGVRRFLDSFRMTNPIR
jgi:hypothetical protein